MNESSKTTDFLMRLRKRMPNAVVVKHRDASMIGLPDFSVTCRGHVLWNEAKLYPLPKKFDGDYFEFIAKARKESPTQADMMDKLARASASAYVIWVKKSFIVWQEPGSGRLLVFRSDGELAEHIAKTFDAWDGPPFPQVI